MKKRWFVLLMCLVIIPVFSQKKLAFGITVSAYKANNLSAMQYDGSQQFGIDWVVRSSFNEDKLLQLFNGDRAVVVEYPDKMEYPINAAIGENSICQLTDEL